MGLLRAKKIKPSGSQKYQSQYSFKLRNIGLLRQYTNKKESHQENNQVELDNYVLKRPGCVAWMQFEDLKP